MPTKSEGQPEPDKSTLTAARTAAVYGTASAAASGNEHEAADG
jgi:hypothetical protein